MYFPGEQQAITQALEVGAKYGYGNIIAHLKTMWAKGLIKKGWSEDSAWLASNTNGMYPLDLVDGFPSMAQYESMAVKPLDWIGNKDDDEIFEDSQILKADTPYGEYDIRFRTGDECIKHGFYVCFVHEEIEAGFDEIDVAKEFAQSHFSNYVTQQSLKVSACKKSDGPRGVWPDLIAPPMHEKHPPEWVDPALPDIRVIWSIARECGYAVGVHGSLKKDFDLIAVPWVDEAVSAEKLVERLNDGLNAKIAGYIEPKPHGRVAVVLQPEGYFKNIDLSILLR